MAQLNQNIVAFTGNLTRDPLKWAEDRCTLAVAVGNGNNRDGSQRDPTYVDVTVFGTQAQNCLQYLAKSRPVAVTGRLASFRDEKIAPPITRLNVVAQSVQFLNSREDSEGSSANGSGASQASEEPVPF